MQISSHQIIPTNQFIEIQTISYSLLTLLRNLHIKQSRGEGARAPLEILISLTIQV